MSNSTQFVSFDHSLFRTQLQLKRTPKYLRFTCHGCKTPTRSWDALDQEDDTAADGEYLFAAVLENRGSLHIDKTVNGRRVAEWHGTAHYVPIAEQPTQELMRDNAKWRAWCMQREGIEVPE